jgi:hypothetical protein
VGVGLGVGRKTCVVGPTTCPAKDGTGNDATGSPCIATDMKSCQISAGIVPPYTGDTPSTLFNEISPFG